MVERTANPQGVIEAFRNVEGAIGDFIANGPSTGIQGYIRDQYRNRCNQFANAPGWAQSLAVGPAGSLGRICQPWYDAQGADGPVLEPPFTGGQCPVFYVATFQQRVFSQAQQQYIWSNTITSPQFLGPASVGGGATGDQCSTSDETAQSWFVRDGNGNNAFQLASGCADVVPSYRQLQFSRVDGQPDNCGDPPAELQPGPNPPPDPGPTPGPEPTSDPNNPTGPPLLPIPPYIDPIGGPTPIEAPDPFEPVAGPDDIPGNPDSGPGGADNVSDPISVSPPPEGGGEETDFGEPPAGRSWVGCLLQFDFPPSVGVIAGSGPANPVSPRAVGNASLVFDGGRGDAFVVRSGSMVLVRPTGALAVTGVYVNSEPGITYTIRPLSLKNCPDNECASEE